LILKDLAALSYPPFNPAYLLSHLWLYFGQSAETSDFIVDCLLAWWQAHQQNYPEVAELAIDLDGGSAVRSNRTQFIKRIAQFCQVTGLKVRLIYYPPYHSKYNPIERCLGGSRKLLEWGIAHHCRDRIAVG
jgi:hypothetical protein